MTIALWCVLVAGLLPYAATVIAKLGGARFDNRDPRAWLERQTGRLKVGLVGNNTALGDGLGLALSRLDQAKHEENAKRQVRHNKTQYRFNTGAQVKGAYRRGPAAHH